LKNIGNTDKLQRERDAIMISLPMTSESPVSPQKHSTPALLPTSEKKRPLMHSNTKIGGKKAMPATKAMKLEIDELREMFELRFSQLEQNQRPLRNS